MAMVTALDITEGRRMLVGMLGGQGNMGLVRTYPDLLRFFFFIGHHRVSARKEFGVNGITYWLSTTYLLGITHTRI